MIRELLPIIFIASIYCLKYLIPILPTQLVKIDMTFALNKASNRLNAVID